MSNSVCLISQNEFWREGLSSILTLDGFNVVISADGLDEIDQLDIQGKFIALLDISDSKSAEALVEQTAQLFPQAMIVVLADRFDLEDLIASLNAGAQGYLIKAQRSKPLITSLRLVALGEKVFPSEIFEVLQRQSIAENNSIESSNEIADVNLSPRERDVLCCLMAGYQNKQIARHLDLCEATVKVHVKAILRKLNVRNRTQAAIWASAHKVADASELPCV